MNDAFRQQFQRVLPLCGAIGRTSSRPGGTAAQSTRPAATAALTYVQTVKACDVGDRLTMFVDSGGPAGELQ